MSPVEIVFTSGATEANNLALFGMARHRRTRGSHVIYTALEHSSVVGPCDALETEGFRVSRLGCDALGFVDAEHLEGALTPDTIVASIMLANNEVGTVQPVAEIASLARPRGVVIHCDAAQACGKMRLRPHELGVDLMTLSAHKMHGPRGAGVLFVREGVDLEPLFRGGGQESGRRPGTENVLGAIGLAAALRVAERDLEENVAHMERLRSRLRDGLAEQLPQAVLDGDVSPRLPSILNVRFPGLESEALVLSLDAEGVCVSSGSACYSGDRRPSSVLLAMGLDTASARSALRFSVAADTNEREIDRALVIVPALVDRMNAAP